MSITIFAIGAVIFFGHLLQLLFKKTSIPDVLVLTLLGIVVGPVLGIVSPADFGKIGPVIAIVALVTILFESGTTLNIDQLRQSYGRTLVLAIGSFVMTVAVVALAAHQILGLQLVQSLLAGFILGGPSSAIVIPLVVSLAPGEKAGTVLVLESAFTDVIAIIGVFALIQLASGAGISPGILIGQVGAAFLFAAAIGFGGALGWLTILRRIRGFPNTISSTLAFVFIIYGITEMLGFSGAVAALCLGITLANHQEIGWQSIRERSRNVVALTDMDYTFYREAVFLLKVYFFIYLGISMHFSDLYYVGVAIFVILVVLLLRSAIVRGVLTGPDFSLRDKMLASALAPKGLAAAVLAGVPLQQGIADGVIIRDFAYMVILVSIIICAFAVMTEPIGIFKRMYARIFREQSSTSKDASI